MKPPACAPDRIVETYRDHTSTARRQHIYEPLQSTDKPMSLRECIAWCGFISSMAGYAVSVMMGWVSNPVSWVMS